MLVNIFGHSCYTIITTVIQTFFKLNIKSQHYHSESEQRLINLGFKSSYIHVLVFLFNFIDIIDNETGGYVICSSQNERHWPSKIEENVYLCCLKIIHLKIITPAALLQLSHIQLHNDLNNILFFFTSVRISFGRILLPLNVGILTPYRIYPSFLD